MDSTRDKDIKGFINSGRREMSKSRSIYWLAHLLKLLRSNWNNLNIWNKHGSLYTSCVIVATGIQC